MASVEKRVRDGRTSYLVRWRDEEGKQRKKSFVRMVDANRFKAEVAHSLNTGAYIDPGAGKRTFRDFAEAWRKGQPHRRNTELAKISQLTKHIYPAIGDRSIASIRPSELQAFVTSLDLAPSSVRTLFATVRSVFLSALADRAIGIDPTATVKLPKVARKKVVPLTVEEVDALIDAAPARFRALVITCAGTGLRQGEAFGLQIRDVDFLRKTMTVERQVQPAKGGGHSVVPLKTESSARTIPIGTTVVAALAAHLAQWPTDGDQFIFRDDAGRPLTGPLFMSTVWYPLRKAAGLRTAGMHDLRHFYASALIRHGLNVKVLSERLGHQNAAMTLNVYSHLWPDDEDRTREAVDVMFERSTTVDVPRVRPAKGA